MVPSPRLYIATLNHHASSSWLMVRSIRRSYPCHCHKPYGHGSTITLETRSRRTIVPIACSLFNQHAIFQLPTRSQLQLLRMKMAMQTESKESTSIASMD